MSVGGRIAGLTLRGILDSRGTVTVEAEVALEGGVKGRGSAPVAIARGRRERRPAPIAGVGGLSGSAVLGAVREAVEGHDWPDQAALDAELEALAAHGGVGANVTLAVSLAFCRAAGRWAGVPLHRRLAADGGCGGPRMSHVLVNVFSGGIHGLAARVPFQQIMLVAEGPSLRAEIEHAAAIYGAVEASVARRGHVVRHSASSGLLVDADPDTLLALLSDEIARHATGTTRLGLGIDVAAEHLRAPDKHYAVGPGMSSDHLADLLADLARRHAVRYLEDPFDPDDRDAWPALLSRLDPAVLVFGDDIFATSEAYVDPTFAHGMVVKMSQAGTVTATLRAARAARAAGLLLCVSHRSGETEDTAMCDLAVGAGAEFIKIGGPRRGDRVAKYNQLLRLADALAAGGGD